MDGVCVLNLGAMLGETVKLNVMEKSKCKASERDSDRYGFWICSDVDGCYWLICSALQITIFRAMGWIY
jgi:hypothetical protein